MPKYVTIDPSVRVMVPFDNPKVRAKLSPRGDTPFEMDPKDDRTMKLLEKEKIKKWVKPPKDSLSDEGFPPVEG